MSLDQDRLNERKRKRAKHREKRRPKRISSDFEIREETFKTYQELDRGRFDWIPWDEMLSHLEKKNALPFGIYKLETAILENQTTDRTATVGRFAFKTKRGPPGAHGVLGRPEHAYIKIWEVHKLKKKHL